MPDDSQQGKTGTTVETQWGVADERGWLHGVTPCESEDAARQYQADHGGKVVFRETLHVRGISRPQRKYRRPRPAIQN